MFRFVIVRCFVYRIYIIALSFNSFCFYYCFKRGYLPFVKGGPRISMGVSSNSWNISSMGVQIFRNIWTGGPFLGGSKFFMTDLLPWGRWCVLPAAAATEATLTDLQCNSNYTIAVVATAGEHRREGVAFLPQQGILIRKRRTLWGRTWASWYSLMVCGRKQASKQTYTRTCTMQSR